MDAKEIASKGDFGTCAPRPASWFVRWRMFSPVLQRWFEGEMGRGRGDTGDSVGGDEGRRTACGGVLAVRGVFCIS